MFYIYIDPVLDPPNHFVKMGENATFHCMGSALDIFWTINDYQSNSYQLPLRYIQRGFVLQEYQGLKRNLTILASEQNNNTKVWCRIQPIGGSSHLSKSNRALFTVIGK